MPKRIIQPANQEFYHIIKRSIDNRLIFSNPEDCLRAINSLLVFNDKELTPWEHRIFWSKRSPESLASGNYTPKTPLIEIHAFCLMPNHIHLLVRQLIEKGIQIVMQKFGGFSRYFNKKYKREGTLFQDRYKIVHIEDEVQLKNTFVYIHTNPVALVEPNWKKWEIKNPSKTINFLEKKYRWTSLWDYLGKKNFPQVITRDFFLELLGGKKGIKQEISSWIEFKNDVFENREKLEEFILELEY